MREHYDIANLIANVIDIISIIILLLIFKMKVSKGSMKGCAKGICVYGLPITAFSVFYSVQAIYWIFNGSSRAMMVINWLKNWIVNLSLYLTVGIEEELIFRGVVLNCIFRKNKTIVLGCLYSGLLFGLAHLENLIWGEDMNPVTIWSTIIFGCIVGFVWSVIYLRTKSLWSVILLHFAWDFFGIL